MTYDTMDRYVDELEDECHISSLKIHKLLEAIKEARQALEVFGYSSDDLKKIEEAIKYAETN